MFLGVSTRRIEFDSILLPIDIYHSYYNQSRNVFFDGCFVHRYLTEGRTMENDCTIGIYYDALLGVINFYVNGIFTGSSVYGLRDVSDSSDLFPVIMVASEDHMTPICTLLRNTRRCLPSLQELARAQIVKSLEHARISDIVQIMQYLHLPEILADYIWQIVKRKKQCAKEGHLTRIFF